MNLHFEPSCHGPLTICQTLIRLSLTMFDSSDFDSDWVLTASGRIRLLKSGIIQVEIKTDHTQTPEDARDNLRIATGYCLNQTRAVLLDLRGTDPLSVETRTVYMHPDMAKSFKALALVVSSDKMSRLMGNIYMLVARLPFPMRLFNATEDAKSWLKNY